MPSSVSQTRELHVGAWRVRPDLNRLRGSEGEIQLEPQTMRVLVALLHRPGEVLTRSRLHELAWDGAAVSDESLSRAIFDLRKALGDRASDPVYIETIRKVGYRLIAPVKVVEGATPVDGAESAVEADLEIDPEAKVGPESDARAIDSAARLPVAGRTARVVGWAATVTGLLALALAWFFFTDRRPTDGELSQEPPRTRQLTSYAGYETHPAVSADGSRLAFSWDGGGGDQVDIYWRALEDAIPRQLTDDAARDDGPAWAPDGRRLAFVRRAETRCHLMLGDTASGEVRRLLTCREAWISPPVWAGAGDGDGLIYSDRDAPDESFRLYRFDLETGRVDLLSTPPFGSFGDVYPALSESGERLAFLRATAQSTISTYLTPAIGDIFTLDLSRGDSPESSRQLTFDNLLVSGLAWVDGDSVIAYAARRAGRGYGIWRVATDAASDAQPWLANTGGLLRLPTRAAGANRVAFERWDGQTDLWRLDLGDPAQPAQQTAISPSTRSDLNPRWHPGGERIAFTSARTGNYEIWTSDIDGKAARQLTSLVEASAESPMWSPDGQRIVFEARSAGRSHLYVVDDPGEVQQLTASVFDDRAPSWSVDGGSVYFASNRSGSWQVWRLDLESSRVSQVTREGGYRALEAELAGERVLFFSKRDENGIWRWESELGARRVAPLDAAQWGNWDLVDGTLYFVELLESRQTRIDRLDLATGERSEAALLDGWISRETPNLSVSPDRRTVLLARFTGLAADLILLEGS